MDSQDHPCVPVHDGGDEPLRHLRSLQVKNFKSIADNWNSVASAICESTKDLGEFAVHCNGPALRVYYGRLKGRLANLVNVDAKKSGQAGYEKVLLIMMIGSKILV